jgi:hypothetical protein
LIHKLQNQSLNNVGEMDMVQREIALLQQKKQQILTNPQMLTMPKNNNRARKRADDDDDDVESDNEVLDDNDDDDDNDSHRHRHHNGSSLNGGLPRLMPHDSASLVHAAPMPLASHLHFSKPYRQPPPAFTMMPLASTMPLTNVTMPPLPALKTETQMQQTAPSSLTALDALAAATLVEIAPTPALSAPLAVPPPLMVASEASATTATTSPSSASVSAASSSSSSSVLPPFSQLVAVANSELTTPLPDWFNRDVRTLPPISVSLPTTQFHVVSVTGAPHNYESSANATNSIAVVSPTAVE